MSWWTCQHCYVTFFIDSNAPEPSNGHGIACTKCWTLPCQGRACPVCALETKRQMFALDRVVNADA